METDGSAMKAVDGLSGMITRPTIRAASKVPAFIWSNRLGRGGRLYSGTDGIN